MSNLLKICPKCKKTALKPTFFTKSFFPGGNEVKVTLLKSVCIECGFEVTSGTQHDHNLTKLEERRSQYGIYPLGEDYRKLKKKYNLTNAHLSKIFGRKLDTVGGYITEKGYPCTSIAHLTRILLKSPAVFREVAELSGISLKKETSDA